MIWQPVDSAPKDGTRILIAYDTPQHGSEVGIFQWYPDALSKTPMPYWCKEGSYASSVDRSLKHLGCMPLPEFTGIEVME